MTFPEVRIENTEVRNKRSGVFFPFSFFFRAHRLKGIPEKRKEKKNPTHWQEKLVESGFLRSRSYRSYVCLLGNLFAYCSSCVHIYAITVL